MTCRKEGVTAKPRKPMRSWWLGCRLSVLLATFPSASPAQTMPDSIHSRLLAVFGEGALADSTMVVLTRAGFRVADRSAHALQRARTEGRRLPPAELAVVVNVRPDPSTQQRVLVAELLDINAIQRLRRASVPWPVSHELWAASLTQVIDLLFMPQEDTQSARDSVVPGPSDFR